MNASLQAQLLPANEAAERAILGVLMLEPDAIYAVSELLSVEDFYLPSHRTVFGTIFRLAESGTPIDSITVSAELRRRLEIDSIGGAAYLADLTSGIPRNFKPEPYCKIVREKAILRRGMQLCTTYSAEMALEEDDAEAILSRFQGELMGLSAGTGKVRAEVVGDVLPRVMKQIAEERANPSREVALGYTYAVPELDQLTKGAFPGEYTILLAETGGAKTAYSVQITLENALRGIKSHWFSQEMTKEQLTRRLLSSLSKIVKAKDLRDPRWIGVFEWEDLQKTADLLSTLGITIDDSRRLPLDQLVARGKAAIMRDGAKLIFTDYIQLTRAESKSKNVNDTERIEATTLALRDLAAEHSKYGVHVFGLSQYSRPQDGGRGRPSNSRAKGSSSLEQSCQCMLHLSRELNEDGSMSTDAEIRIGKSREGKLGSIQCVFDEDHLRFVSRG